MCAGPEKPRRALFASLVAVGDLLAHGFLGQVNQVVDIGRIAAFGRIFRNRRRAGAVNKIEGGKQGSRAPYGGDPRNTGETSTARRAYAHATIGASGGR